MRVCKLVCAAVCALGLIAAAACSTAQPAPQAAPQAPLAPPSPKVPAPLVAKRPVKAAFLWRIQGDGEASYALGTVHIGVSLGDALGPGEPRFLDGAREVFLEADLMGLDPLTLLSTSMLPVGESLRDMVSSRAWTELLINTGLPPGMLERMRPWVAHMMAQVGALRETLVREGSLSTMDLEIQQRRIAAGQPVDYLETAKEQLDILSGIEDREYAGYLNQWLLEGDISAELKSLLIAYRAGDLETMSALVFDPENIEGAADYYERLLFARNRRWLTRLGPELKEGNVFIAVGLAHLLGQQGLLAAWEAQGLTITRVPVPATE